MKKLKQACLALLAIVVAILSIVNYSFDTQDVIEKDKEIISIKKPNNISNQEFLNNVGTALEEEGIDIMYRYVDVSGEKVRYLYYKTNVNEDFVNCASQKDTMKIGENECISTESDNLDMCKAYRLKASSLFSDFTFYDWDAADKFDLSQGYYFVKADQVNRISAILSDLEYQVSHQLGVYISAKLSLPLFTAIPIVLVIMTFLFYACSIAKGNVIKKMDGYSNMNIWAENLKNDVCSCLICVGMVEIVLCVVAHFLFPHCDEQFFRFHGRYLWLIVSTVLSAEILSFIVIVNQNSPEYIKGKVPKKGIYHLTMVTKAFFLFFIIFFLSIAIRNVVIGVNTYNTSKHISKMVEQYVGIPIYNNNASIEHLDNNFLDFYIMTVERYDGVVIDASNYEYDLITNTTLAEEYNQQTITINKNYLSLNPIYDDCGKVITKECVHNDTIHLLLPNSKVDERSRHIEFVEKAYGCTPQIINYDDKKTEIYSYNANSGMGEYGKIIAPIIVILPDKYFTGEYIFSYCSKGSYFLKVEGNEPYEELLPILEECGIEKVVPHTPYIISRFNSVLEQQMQMFAIYGSQSILLTLGMICLIYFSAKIYCENYKRKMAYQFVEGFSVCVIIGKHIWYILIEFVLVFMGLNCIKKSISVSVNQELIGIFLLLDLFYTYVMCRKNVKKNLYETIKGAE